MTDAELLANATRFVFSLLPRDHVDHDLFSLAAEWRGDERWAVLMRSWCMSRSGEWDHEPIPSSRDDEWLAEHRFSRDEAIARASNQETLARMEVNGKTAKDVA